MASTYDPNSQSYTVTSGSTLMQAGNYGSNNIVDGGAGNYNSSGGSWSTPSAFIMSGGTALGGTALNGAYMAAVTAAGTIYNGVAYSAASIDAAGGGITSGATALQSGAIFAGALTGSITGAGSAYNPYVASGGYALVGGGGAGFTVKGFAVQGSGGLISGGTYDPGSMMMIGNGGTSIGGNLNGRQMVLSNGTALKNLFSGSGATQLINGGVSSQSTAIQGATLSVSGATGVSLVALNGGTVTVGGGTYETLLTSGFATSVGSYTSGTSFNDIVSSGGQEIITSNGTAISSHILSGGSGTVTNGGTAIGIDVNGGTESVTSGGIITTGSASNGGFLTVQSGGSAGQLTANIGGTVVADSGSIGSLTINGGTGDVIDGGQVINYTVNSGTGLVDSGSILSGVTVNSGQASINNGAVVSGGVTVYGGSAQILSGASVDFMVADNRNSIVSVQSNAVLNSLYAAAGGTGIVSAGGTVTSAFATNNTPNISTASAGTIQIAGNVASVGAINGGVLLLSSGASAASITINGGTGTVLGGAQIPNTLSINGNLSNGRVFGGLLFTQGTETFGTVNVSSGGTSVFNSGASVNSLNISNNASALLNSNASASNVILSGGTSTVNGGTITTLSASQNGTAIFQNGALVSNMVLSSGFGTIQSGATILNLSVQNGGSGVLLSGASVQSISVASGGWVSGAKILNGQEMTVSSGGTALNTTVTYSGANSSALPNVATAQSGGTLINTTISGSTAANLSGGLLTVQSGAVLQNTSMGWNARLRVLGLQYDAGGSTFVQGGTLHVIENGKDWQLALNGNYADGNSRTDGFTITSDASGNTIVTYSKCFLAGTLIRMDRKNVPVENIQRGDAICTLVDGKEHLRTVTAVVKRTARVLVEQPEDMAGWSVTIRAHAFSDGVPSRDLSVTPEHCFYFNGKFTPIRMLVNGQSIYYNHDLTEYDFYHVETEPHSIIWANDALTESYLNTDERQALTLQEDATSHVVPLPTLTWDENAAAPLDISKEFVEPLFKTFLERAQSGTSSTEEHHDSLVTDPDLSLLLPDGTLLKPTRTLRSHFVFSLPAHVSEVRIQSRLFRPSENIGPFLDDRRTLGVLVGDISLWDDNTELPITHHLTTPDLQGWSVVEDGPHRWTTGTAHLPLPENTSSTDTSRALIIQVQAGGPYKK